MSKPSSKPKKKTNGYKKPDRLPAGEVLKDVTKKQWVLGPSIGTGGFGEIYSAQPLEGKGTKKFPYVIKIEPHENGPLFVEMHFYMKNCKEQDISEFTTKHKLKTLGIPAFIGSGSHEFNGVKYRFLVMEKFGDDINKILTQNGNKLPVKGVFQLAYQMTYALEYIHSCGYVHADLKGANILLGDTSSNKHQAYLVDFGLATKYTTNKQFTPNPKKAHDGTIEYLSRDAHLGVATMRGDFEILLYNIIHWLGGQLPWIGLNDPKIVQQKKEGYMTDSVTFLSKCFKKQSIPEVLKTFLKYFNTLKFSDEPNYEKIRDMFEAEAGTVSGALALKSSTASKRKSSSAPASPQKATKEKTRAPSEEPPIKKRGVKPKKPVAEDNATGEIMTAAMKEIVARNAAKVHEKKTSKAPKKETNGYNQEMIDIAQKIKKNGKKEEDENDQLETKAERFSRRAKRDVNYDERSIEKPRKIPRKKINDS